MSKPSESPVIDVPGKIKIFVVSMSKDLVRRNQIKKNLAELGLNFEFFDAIVGTELSNYERNKYSEKETVLYIGRELSQSELGCALSHLYVYAKILEQGLDYAVILEDDVLLLNDFNRVVNAIVRRGQTFEIFNFLTDAPEIGTKEFLLNSYEITKLRFYSNRTTAYMVSRNAAARLLEVGFPIKTSADGLLGEKALHGLSLNGIYPNIATLYPFESTINKGHYSASKIVTKRKKRSPKFWRGRWYVLKSGLR